MPASKTGGDGRLPDAGRAADPQHVLHSLLRYGGWELRDAGDIGTSSSVLIREVGTGGDLGVELLSAGHEAWTVRAATMGRRDHRLVHHPPGARYTETCFRLVAENNWRSQSP